MNQDLKDCQTSDTISRRRTYPEEIYKLAERLLAAEDGRYQLIVSKTGRRLRDVTVCRLGKVEVL